MTANRNTKKRNASGDVASKSSKRSYPGGEKTTNNHIPAPALKQRKKRHTILIVDDELPVLKALERTFRDICNVLTAISGDRAIELFKKHDVSLVIADQRMPEMTGVELFMIIRKIKPEAIKIMLTAYTDTGDIIYAINHCNLYQYITKPWEDADIRLRVATALESYERALAIQEKSQELETLNLRLEDANQNLNLKVQKATRDLIRANRELEKLAITDPLTGVNNRRYFEERLKKEFTRVKRYAHSLSLIMIDIDYFKMYNDKHGHLLGDAVLRGLSHIFSSSVRTSDFVSRYGGEEFVLTLPETDKIGALEIAERIRQSVEDHDFPHSIRSQTGKITISTGIASFPEDTKTPEDLLQKADVALYRAKEMGRNRIILHE